MQFSLHHGDCLDLLPDIPAKSVDLICADLPFGTTDCAWDSLIDLDALWAEYRRVLAPGGCCVLFGSMPFTSTLYESNKKWYKDHLVWDKNKCGSPGLAKVRPMRVHEDALVFAPGRTVYNPQMEVGEPYSRKTVKPGGYVGRNNAHGYGLKPRVEFHNDGTRYPKSIIRISRDFSAQQQVHSAQKPVPLLTWIIKTYSNRGATVLDNTMGSGSTGVACVPIGRGFVGIEKFPVPGKPIDPDTNPDCFGIAQSRIRQAQIEAFEAEL